MEQARKKREMLICDTRNTLYMGIEIPTEFIRATMPTREWYDSLVDEYFGL